MVGFKASVNMAEQIKNSSRVFPELPCAGLPIAAAFYVECPALPSPSTPPTPGWGRDAAAQGGRNRKLGLSALALRPHPDDRGRQHSMDRSADGDPPALRAER